jgi:membrane protease YdiL (CAAX protease family)
MTELAALVLLATRAVAATGPIAGFATLAAVGLAVARPHPTERVVALLCVASFIPVWQAAMALALAAYLVATRAWPDGWTRGTVPLGLTIATAAVTPFGLVGWFLWANPDLADLTATYVPDVPVPVLIAGALMFVAVNATLEEAVWRGLFQPGLAARFGVGGAIVIQATSFGLAHAHGFPRGPLGVALAGGWAVLLGALRARSDGLLAPIVAHLVADAVIAVIVLTRVA